MVVCVGRRCALPLTITAGASEQRSPHPRPIGYRGHRGGAGATGEPSHRQHPQQHRQRSCARRDGKGTGQLVRLVSLSPLSPSLSLSLPLSLTLFLSLSLSLSLFLSLAQSRPRSLSLLISRASTLLVCLPLSAVLMNRFPFGSLPPSVCSSLPSSRLDWWSCSCSCHTCDTSAA